MCLSTLGVEWAWEGLLRRWVWWCLGVSGRLCGFLMSDQGLSHIRPPLPHCPAGSCWSELPWRELPQAVPGQMWEHRGGAAGAWEGNKSCPVPTRPWVPFQHGYYLVSAAREYQLEMVKPPERISPGQFVTPTSIMKHFSLCVWGTACLLPSLRHH